MANTRTSTDPERDDRSQDADRQHSDHAGVEVGTTFERTVDEGRGRLRRTWPGLLATGAVGGVDSCSRPRRSTTPSWCLWRCSRPCDLERPLATWTAERIRVGVAREPRRRGGSGDRPPPRSGGPREARGRGAPTLRRGRHELISRSMSSSVFCTCRPAARPRRTTAVAILADASSIISLPNISAPRRSSSVARR